MLQETPAGFLTMMSPIRTGALALLFLMACMILGMLFRGIGESVRTLTKGTSTLAITGENLVYGSQPGDLGQQLGVSR